MIKIMASPCHGELRFEIAATKTQWVIHGRPFRGKKLSIKCRERVNDGALFLRTTTPTDADDTIVAKKRPPKEITKVDS